MSKTEILGLERRRKFTDAEKAALLAEAVETSISAVSERHGIARAVLHSWKRQNKPKAFAVLEVNDQPETPPRSQPAKSKPAAIGADMIRVGVQKRIVVEFPITVEPSAIARFIKALEN